VITILLARYCGTQGVRINEQILETFQVSTDKKEGGYEITFVLITGSSNNKRYCGIN
jgi:hypothetical protein